MMPSRSGARTPQEDRKEGKDARTAYFDLTKCSVERKAAKAAQPPRVARRCTSSLGHTARQAKESKHQS